MTIRPIGALILAVITTAGSAAASLPTAQQQVLAREALWVKSAATQDATTLATILDDGFVHINYQGRIEGKAAMLARIRSQKSRFVQRTSDHTVTLDGPVAIVHGINSIISGGRVVFRLRYTDVYVKRRSAWKAVSAQETAVQ